MYLLSFSTKSKAWYEIIHECNRWSKVLTAIEHPLLKHDYTWAQNYSMVLTLKRSRLTVDDKIQNQRSDVNIHIKNLNKVPGLTAKLILWQCTKLFRRTWLEPLCFVMKKKTLLSERYIVATTSTLKLSVNGSRTELSKC